MNKRRVRIRRTADAGVALLAAALVAVSVLLLVTREAAASGVEGAAANFEKQAEEIEARLSEEPGNEGLLADLTRARINVADAMIAGGAGESRGGIEEVKQQLALAAEDWSEYLKVAVEPSPGLAIQVAPALFRRAELSSDAREALEDVKAAAAAQKIVVEDRPGRNSWSMLALYELFAQDYRAADEAIENAIRYAHTRFERDSIKDKFEEVEIHARQFGRRLRDEMASKAGSAGKAPRGRPGRRPRPQVAGTRMRRGQRHGW